MPSRAIRKSSVAWTLLAWALLASCGDDDVPSRSGVASAVDSTAADVQPDDAGTDDASGSDGQGGDTLVLDTAEAIGADGGSSGNDCPGGAGCACKDNTDCQTGLCIEDSAVSGGKACAKKCEGACGSGYACAAVPAASGDIVSICVPKFLHLCEPCATSKDCAALGLQDAACVDEGSLGRFCGVSCAEASDCPGGYACAQVSTAEGGSLKQCVRSADDQQQPFGVCPCSPLAVQKKLATACYVEVKDAAGTVTGQCSGVRTCTAAGLSGCIAPEAKAEMCNGQDDDCDGQTDEGSCDDGKPCTQDACAGAQGCQHTPLDGAPCDADGTVCTENDSCLGGACVAGAKKSCDDKNPCTADSCDLAKGCTQVADDGAPCDDDNPCTLGDVCQAKQCLPGAPKLCTSTKPCVLAECDLQDGGKCSYPDKKDGSVCDDGDACTAADGCDQGSCVGKLVSCDDQNPCTDDSCAPANGCVYKANSAPCDDGNACTKADACTASQCAGQPLDLAVDCNDGNPCTSADCDPKQGCSQGANQAACDDGNPCTQGDVCAAKACTAGANICACQKDGDCASEEDGDLCNGTLFCDTAKLPYVCKVNEATVVVCDASKDTACATQVCAPKSGVCGAVPAPDAKACDADGSVCTVGDTCVSGICKAGTQLGCDDDNPCTTDSCDPAAGCQNVANTLPCDADKSVCTVADTCKDGFCLKGAGLDCDDNNPCTTDSCNPAVGCEAVPNGLACNDGNACTSSDTCANAACNGAAVGCDDKDPCTADGCDAATGCIATPLVEKADCSADGKNWCVGGKCVAKAFCGDGKVNVGGEQCDDGNADDADGCNNACQAPCGAVCLTDSYYTTAATAPDLFTSAATFFAVVRATATDGPRIVVSHPRMVSGTGFALGQQDGVWGAYLNNGGNFNGGVYTGKVAPGEWTKIAGVYDGKTIKLFVNGKLLGATAAPPTLSPSALPLFIGAEDPALGRQFQGCIDTAAAWNVALSDAEVVALTTAAAVPAEVGSPLLVVHANGAPLAGYGKLAGPLTQTPAPKGQVEAVCAPPCGDGQRAAWEPCDDGNTLPGDGCDGLCQLEPAASCKALLQQFPDAADGVYPIDPDGAGPIAAANLFCDMKNGGWTLAGNYYDAAGDDMPNSTAWVVSGWQQTASGQWDAKAATVDRAWGGSTGSAAVSLAFVEALGKSAGQKHLKFCFVHKDGYDTTCRQSSDGSLTLVSDATGNPKLTAFKDDTLTYTFGRLGGLAGSADGYDPALYTYGKYKVPVVADNLALAYDKPWGMVGWLDDNPPTGCKGYIGPWAIIGGGAAYRPFATDNQEISAGTCPPTDTPIADPSLLTYGFRLYIGPEPTLGTKANPAKSCNAILAAKASLGDGSYWLDPDGNGPKAPMQVWCDMTRDGGGWTLVGMVHRANANNVAEPHNWFVAGNNSAALAYQQETIDAAPSAWAASSWQPLLGGAVHSRFDLVAHLNPGLTKSWYKAVSWNAFSGWFENDASATLVCSDLAMAQNCSSATISAAGGMTNLGGMSLSHFGYASTCNVLHMRLNGDAADAFSAVCSCTGNNNNNAWPDSGGDNHWGNGLRVWLRESICGDGVATWGEQCDDGNAKDGDGCSACKVEPMANCKAILAQFPAAPSGTYSIDPDGPGGGAAFPAACDMTTSGGGWTRLVAPMAGSLKAAIDREYLYTAGGRWYRSPVTQQPWSWAGGFELKGSYVWWNGSQNGTLTCNGSGEKPQFGVGCSNGGGGTAKVLPAYAKDEAAGTVTVCQDIPNAFGGPVCQVGVAAWVR